MRGSWRLAPRHQRTAEARPCASGLESLCGAPEWAVHEAVELDEPQCRGDLRMV